MKVHNEDLMWLLIVVVAFGVCVSLAGYFK
jgi:uncharacterized Rmd1/YagE family protein